MWRYESQHTIPSSSSAASEPQHGLSIGQRAVPNTHVGTKSAFGPRHQMAGLPLSATRPDITPSSILRLQRQDTTLGSLSASSSSQQAGTFQAVYDYLRPVRVWFALHGALSIANFICRNSPSRAVNGRVITCAAGSNRTTWCRFTVESVHESCDETAAGGLGLQWGFFSLKGQFLVPRVDHVLLCGVVVLYLSI
jgi:hypothetical protein